MVGLGATDHAPDPPKPGGGEMVVPYGFNVNLLYKKLALGGGLK